MASTTRRQYCELISRMLNGGFMSDDSTTSINLISLHLSGAIAAAAVKDMRSNIEIDGIATVGDAFYATTKGLAITKDSDTGWYKSTLPQPPVSISRGLDITSFKLIAQSGIKYSAYRVSPVEWDYMNELPIESNKVYFMVLSNGVIMQSRRNLTNDKAMVTMVSSQTNTGTGMDDTISLPDNYLPDIVQYMAGVFNIQLNIPIDNANDGAPTQQIK